MTDPAVLARALANRLAADMPANVALMLLLMEAASPEAAAAALRLAPRGGASLDAVERLWRACPDAWTRVHAVSDSVEHDAVFGPQDDPVERWRATFDRLAGEAPEAGVALYALGDPELLAAATAEVVDVLRRWRLLGPHRDLLDFGCGMGRLAEALAPEMRSVLGVDLSEGMVEEARRRSSHRNVRFATTPGRDLADLAPAAFDLVLAADVFPYLVEAGFAEAHLIAFARVLRPGGAVVILNYSYRGDPGGDRREIAAMAPTHGFRVLHDGVRPFLLWDAAAYLLRRNGDGATSISP